MPVRPSKLWHAPPAPRPPDLCPRGCSSEPLPILYGLLTDRARERIARGEAIAGGVLSDVRNTPKYRCSGCGEAFGLAFSPRIRRGLISRHG